MHSIVPSEMLLLQQWQQNDNSHLEVYNSRKEPDCHSVYWSLSLRCANTIVHTYKQILGKASTQLHKHVTQITKQESNNIILEKKRMVVSISSMLPVTLLPWYLEITQGTLKGKIDNVYFYLLKFNSFNRALDFLIYYLQCFRQDW
jgi:hypothetical protein